ncbi:hypothetical protein BGZ61DRAFT_307817, partial [Ilyonectria robusta]|uniref:uncharacterized protein n=1 Tax=Ilyonectria robusta TaxID=1079257 RepID=UPI001E8D43F3
LNGQEIVVMLGAHALGRCHTDGSGSSDSWTISPTIHTYDLYKLLLQEKWQCKWDQPAQYDGAATVRLMILPTDFALI